jgi:hypothetical protein
VGGCYRPLNDVEIQLQQIFLRVELNKRNTDDDYEKKYRTGQRGSREVLNKNEWLRAHQRITDREPAKLMASSLIGMSAFATSQMAKYKYLHGEICTLRK